MRSSFLNRKVINVFSILFLILSFYSLKTNNLNEILNSTIQNDDIGQRIKSMSSDTSIFDSEQSNYNHRFQELSQFDTGYGAMNDIFVKDDLAFTTNVGGGLVIFNVSDFTNPIIIGQYNDIHEITAENLWLTESAYTYGISVQGEIAYLADGFNGLVILNISNPTQPVKIGHYLGDNIGVQNLIVQENYIYFRETDKIYVLNVYDPTQPFLVGIIDYSLDSTKDIRDYYVQDDYIYLYADDFIVIDISNLNNPIEIARLETTPAVKLAFADDCVYLLSNNSLEIININNPYSPYSTSVLNLTEFTYFVQSICISKTIAYVAGYSEILAINITDKSVPKKIGTLVNLGFSWKKLSRQSNILFEQQFSEIVFCADYNQGFLIINFSNPADPILLSATDMGTKTASVSVDGQFVYICTRHAFPWRNTTFGIISWSDPLSPELIGSYQVNKSISDVYVEKNLAYLAIYDEGLEILNLSDPSEPKKIGSLNYGNNCDKKLYFDDKKDLIALANSGVGFTIINVSTPTNPILLSEGNPWFMDVSDVFIDGDFLYLADSQYSGGFGIIDISNPRNPQPVSLTSIGERVFSIIVESGLAYLSTDITPLYIYDTSNLLNPQKLGRCYSDWWFPGFGLSIQNSIVYVAREANGLIAIDVSNPKQPNLLTAFRDNYAGFSYDVVISNDFIFLADGWDGLEILQLVPPLISRKVILLASILPSLFGFSIVIFITIFIIRRQKLSFVP